MGISSIGISPSFYPDFSGSSPFVSTPEGKSVAPTPSSSSLASTTETVTEPTASASAIVTLTEEEQRIVDKMQARDAEVREHEMAHIAAGAGLQISGPTYDYETGPDKQRYAIGGEVQIDVSPGRTPEETVDKAERIRAAALAPPEPSVQDLKVAAQAAQMGIEARRELSRAEGNTSAQTDQDRLTERLRKTFSLTVTGSTVNTYA